MERTFEIEKKTVGLKCSAGTVRAYRRAFNRDLISDMSALEKEIVETKTLVKESEEIAENVAYIMAQEYDNSIPSMDEWLSQFSPFFVYSAIAQVITMWRENLATLNSSKKN